MSPTPVPTGQTPAPSTADIAYVPDGGNGGQPGIDVIRFVSDAGVPYAYPQQMIAFQRSVRSIGISPDGTAAVAVEGSPGSTYPYLQGFLGASQGNLVPGGGTYDAAMLPPPVTPLPSASPVKSPTPTPTDAFIPDVTGVTTFGNGLQGVALTMGPNGGGFPDGTNSGVLGLNQLFEQTPTFAGWTPIGGSPKFNVPKNPRANLVAATASYGGTGQFVLLVRGPHDLVAESITPQFNQTLYVIAPVAYDGGKLGTDQHVLPGRGAMAMDPLDGARAVLAQTSTSATQVVLLTGLPAAITPTTPLTLPAPITVANSVAVSPSGVFAAVGADSGMYILKGVDSTSLQVVRQRINQNGPFKPQYYGADGQKHALANVSSIGFTADGQYVVALANTVANSPGGGGTSSVVVMPFNASSGLVASPVIVANLSAFGAPAANQDFMIVR